MCEKKVVNVNQQSQKTIAHYCLVCDDMRPFAQKNDKDEACTVCGQNMQYTKTILDYA